jgi:hypothetical protein
MPDIAHIVSSRWQCRNTGSNHPLIGILFSSLSHSSEENNDKMPVDTVYPSGTASALQNMLDKTNGSPTHSITEAHERATISHRL